MKLTMQCFRWCLVLAASAAWAAPSRERYEVTPIEEAADWNDATTPVAGKVLQDTVWIADWTFDPACTSPGWIKFDERIFNDGTNYWSLGTAYAGAGGGTITGRAAMDANNRLLAVLHCMRRA